MSTRNGWMAGAFWAATSLVAVAQAPATYVHTYFKQPVPLRLDSGKLAVFSEQIALRGLRTDDASPIAAADAGLAAALDRRGMSAAEAVQESVRGWSTLKSPVSTVAGDADVELLVGELADDAAVEFVSPVFIDERNLPVIITRDVLVGFDDSLDAVAAAALLDQYLGGFVLDRDYGGMAGVYRVRTLFKNGFDVLDRANELAQRPEVRFAEPDMLRRGVPRLIPNDQFFSILWGVHNTGQSGGTVDQDMDGPEAWDITTGAATIKVAILDEGVQQNHPDLNVLAGADFTGNNTVGGGPFNSCDNHGTAVAGCVSAIINNVSGVVGIAPSCKSVSHKIGTSNCDGTFSSTDTMLVNALVYARDTSQCRVTNSSFSYGVSGGITSAYINTRNAGLVHFASTGNDGAGSINYPASIAEVNAVGSLNRFGNRSSFSNFGTGIDFSAPGETIYTTDRSGAAGYYGGNYGFQDGTSFSSPYAAGVAALVLSRNSTLTAAQVESYMQQGCVDRGAAGYDTTYGWGFVNANNTLLLVPLPPGPPGPFNLIGPADASTDAPTTLQLQWSPSAGAATYAIMLDDNATFLHPEVNISGLTGTSYNVPMTLEQGRAYYWKMTATNASGSIDATPALASFSTMLDCNANGVPDATDIAMGTSQDCNENLQPDECDLSTAFRVASQEMTPINATSPQAFVYSARPATGAVTMAFKAFADVNLSNEFINIDLNGSPLGSVFVTGAQDCAAAGSNSVLNVAMTDYNNAIGHMAGAATLNMVPNANVGEQCATPTWITVVITCSATPASADDNSNMVPDECETGLPGDMNCDGVVDILDINPFILALSDPVGYASAYPDCDINNGDVNNDGNVDVLDINPFVALLSGG
ncbi:Thermophilic serine proteinase precursor [Phycisphaerae bacterium RAS1]|nr:Thermophilic serine proteinase precursor [Phycisphaerae bacterium RAS1]